MRKLLASAAFVFTIAASTSAMAATGWSNGPAVLRAGPGANYPVVAPLRAHTRLDVAGCLAGGAWCDVSSHGRHGWVPGSRLQVAMDRRHVPVMRSHPAVVVYNSNQYWDEHYKNETFYNNRVRYGYGTAPGPAAATGRPPYDRTGGDAAHSVVNNVNHMRDDRVYKNNHNGQ